MVSQTYNSVIRGNTIELEASPDLPEGARVDVLIVPEGGLRPGSPVAVLFYMAGTLTVEEATALREAVAAMRQLDAHEISPGY